MKGIKQFLNKENTMGVLNEIKGIAKTGCKLVIPVLGAVILNESTNRSITKAMHYYGNVTYDDAVNSITNSSMWSADKLEVLSKLKRNESSGFYKAVIDIAKSSMWSADKVKAISNMCKDEQEIEREA